MVICGPTTPDFPAAFGRWLATALGVQGAKAYGVGGDVKLFAWKRFLQLPLGNASSGRAVPPGTAPIRMGPVDGRRAMTRPPPPARAALGIESRTERRRATPGVRNLRRRDLQTVVANWGSRFYNSASGDPASRDPPHRCLRLHGVQLPGRPSGDRERRQAAATNHSTARRKASRSARQVDRGCCPCCLFLRNRGTPLWPRDPTVLCRTRRAQRNIDQAANLSRRPCRRGDGRQRWRRLR